MPEPEYIYVKGSGWVVCPDITVKDHNNRLWRFENRRPVPGEYHVNVDKQDAEIRKLTTNGELDLNKLRDYIEKHKFHNVVFRRVSPDFKPDRYFYVTLVAVDD